MIREPIGEIPCPWCDRTAELHASSERRKVSAEGEGRVSYPRKLFVICPPIAGYRGCGTTLANNEHAQARMMELGRVFGPQGKPAKQAAPPPPPAADPAPAAAPARLQPDSRSLLRPFR